MAKHSKASSKKQQKSNCNCQFSSHFSSCSRNHRLSSFFILIKLLISQPLLHKQARQKLVRVQVVNNKTLVQTSDSTQEPTSASSSSNTSASSRSNAPKSWSTLTGNQQDAVYAQWVNNAQGKFDVYTGETYLTYLVNVGSNGVSTYSDPVNVIQNTARIQQNADGTYYLQVPDPIQTGLRMAQEP